MNWRLHLRRFWTVWGLYGAIAAGGVGAFSLGAAALIEKVFYTKDGVTSEAALAFVVFLPIVWLVFALLAIFPALAVGSLHWMMTRWIGSTKVIQMLTCATAALFALPFGVSAAMLQSDGIPILWLPISMILVTVACLYTLRVRSKEYGDST